VVSKPITIDTLRHAIAAATGHRHELPAAS